MNEKLLENTVTEIIESAKREVEKKVREVMVKGDKIIDRKYEEVLREIESKYSQLINNFKQKVDELTRMADRKARESVLLVVNELIEEVFHLALAKINELNRDNKYANVLRSLMLESLRAVELREAIVYVNEKDREIAEAIIKELNSTGKYNLKLGEKALRSVGGVMISSLDAGITYDNTFEARLRGLSDRLRSEVCKILLEKTPVQIVREISERAGMGVKEPVSFNREKLKEVFEAKKKVLHKACDEILSKLLLEIDNVVKTYKDLTYRLKLSR